MLLRFICIFTFPAFTAALTDIGLIDLINIPSATKSYAGNEGNAIISRNLTLRYNTINLPVQITITSVMDPLLTLLKFCVDYQLKKDYCEMVRKILAETVVQVESGDQTPLLQPLMNETSIVLYNMFYSKVENFLSSEFSDRDQENLNIIALNKQNNPEYCSKDWKNLIISTKNTPFIMYVGYHDDASKNLIDIQAYERLQPLFIRNTYFFEYILYRDSLPFEANVWSNAHYVGISSYKTLTYNELCAGELFRLLQLGEKNDYDVIPMVRSSKDFLANAMLSHTTNFKVAWDALLEALGYNQTTIRRFDTIKPFYRNSLFIKPEWLSNLIWFINRAMDMALLNEKVNSYLNLPANYYEGDQMVSMNVFNETGYKLFPFVFERLPSFFLYMNGAKICQDVDCYPNTIF